MFISGAYLGGRLGARNPPPLDFKNLKRESTTAIDKETERKKKKYIVSGFMMAMEPLPPSY